MISIVTTYYNRKRLFEETLRSITKSVIKDFELIVVDDGSDEQERLEDLKSEFPFLKIVRLEKENKWYVNPCVPFNIGIREATGDKIILQNPECLHVHDILKYVDEELDDSKYVSFACYGVAENQNEEVARRSKNGTLEEFVNGLPQQTYRGTNTIGWYNHSKYRPMHYHFCAAITRNNMTKLNGFNERLANGIGFDDDELVVRIKMLRLNLVINDNIQVVHQFHPSHWKRPNEAQLAEVNRKIAVEIIQSNNPYANIEPLWPGN